MNELDERLQDRLDRLVPNPGRDALNWDDALLKAGLRPDRSPRRRRLAVALAALVLVGLAASPLGSAIGNSVGNFSAWVRGEPGQPAAPADQEAFARSNERSFAGFPRGTQLRLLLQTKVDGRQFDLFGFRAGNSLCLQLIARGLGQPQTGCVPVEELERATAPALVVVSDVSFGQQNVAPTEEGYVPALASASFGIAADEVRRVELVDDAGSHRALLGGNAFLSVVDRPMLGHRTRRVSVFGGDGARIALRLAQSPFGARGGEPAKPGTAPGPRKVERVVTRSSIGWIERREPRGVAAPADARYLRGPNGPFGFARVLTPDPNSHMRVLIAVGTLPSFGGKQAQASICTYLLSGVGAGGGCSALANPFPRGPFLSSLSLFGGGDQFATISGRAADEVDRMELFLASGARVAVPLRDNVFVVQVPRTQFPTRLVAYDSDDLVIGIEHFRTDPAAQVGPQPVGEWRVIATARATTGEIARIRLAPATNGGTCYRLSITGGAGGGGCSPRNSTRGSLLALGINSTQTAQFLSGQVKPRVSKVKVLLANGDQLNLEVIEGFVLAALPIDGKAVEATGLDANGVPIARHRFIEGP